MRACTSVRLCVSVSAYGCGSVCVPHLHCAGRWANSRQVATNRFMRTVCMAYPSMWARLCLVQDPRIQRLPCTHSGTYADDCLCERVRQHKCYIVATCDRDLRRRIRKVSLLAAAECKFSTVLSGGVNWHQCFTYVAILAVV